MPSLLRKLLTCAHPRSGPRATTRLAALLTVLGCLVLLLYAAPAQAQASRTWVSGTGDDAMPCDRIAPCKTFAGAISKTATGGEINCLDSAGYGALTITKAININCEGVIGGVLVAGTNGIVVAAGASDKVSLRGLDINGLSQSGTPGTNGIRFVSGQALLVDHCKIYDFGTNGIDVALAAGGSSVDVKDTVITNVAVGIRVTSSAGSVGFTADRVNISRANNGVEAAQGGIGTVSNSVLFGNGNGVAATAAGAIISSETNVLASNSNGAAATVAGATIALDNNFIFANNTGISVAAGATFQSSTTNRLSENGSPGSASNSAMTFR